MKNEEIWWNIGQRKQVCYQEQHSFSIIDQGSHIQCKKSDSIPNQIPCEMYNQQFQCPWFVFQPINPYKGLWYNFIIQLPELRQEWNRNRLTFGIVVTTPQTITKYLTAVLQCLELAKSLFLCLKAIYILSSFVDSLDG